MPESSVTSEDVEDAVKAMAIANIDFEENKGNSRLNPILWDLFEEKRRVWRALRDKFEQQKAISP